MVFAGGHLYLTDIGENGVNTPHAGSVIRAVSLRTGELTPPAGNGLWGYAGDGGPAAAAELWVPTDVTVDSVGNQIVADSFNCRVRVVAARTGTFYGVPMPAGRWPGMASAELPPKGRWR
jgi:hypothetical protein